MNNAKIWLVVHPTVGVPIFLGAVAVGSFAVHVAVLSNTTWVSDFLSGRTLGSSIAALEAPVKGDPAPAQVFFQPTDDGATAGAGEAVVVLPDGRTATVVFEGPGTYPPLQTAQVERPERQ